MPVSVVGHGRGQRRPPRRRPGPRRHRRRPGTRGRAAPGARPRPSPPRRRPRRPATAYSCRTTSSPSPSPTVSRNMAQMAKVPSAPVSTSMQRRRRIQSISRGPMACHASGSPTPSGGRRRAVLDGHALFVAMLRTAVPSGPPSRAQVGHAVERPRRHEARGVVPLAPGHAHEPVARDEGGGGHVVEDLAQQRPRLVGGTTSWRWRRKPPPARVPMRASVHGAAGTWPATRGAGPCRTRPRRAPRPAR